MFSKVSKPAKKVRTSIFMNEFRFSTSTIKLPRFTQLCYDSESYTVFVSLKSPLLPLTSGQDRGFSHRDELKSPCCFKRAGLVEYYLMSCHA